MTYTEAYKNLPYETQMLIEDYAMGFDYGEDCFDGIRVLAGEREESIGTLVRRYGEWEHQKQKALEKLQELGINAEQAYSLYIGYHEYHKI